MKKSIQIANQLAAIESRKANALKQYEETLKQLTQEALTLEAELETAKANEKSARSALKTIGAFQQTKENIVVTFGGWDGKSYKGEGCKLRIWTNRNFPDKKFVKTNHYGGTFHEVLNEIHSVSGLPTVTYWGDCNDCK